MDKIELSKISVEQANTLDQPITLEELRKAHFFMPNNKSPGPGGYPVKFYKHFWHLLSPGYIRMVNEVKMPGIVPSHMNTALISVLLKINKDLTLTPSYRPVSLINKALSNRLESHISIDSSRSFRFYERLTFVHQHAT